MEMNKVIRIVTTFMFVMAISIRVATIVLFDRPLTTSLPLLIAMAICLGIIWRGSEKNKTQNK